jgi:hypothetical protein
LIHTNQTTCGVFSYCTEYFLTVFFRGGELDTADRSTAYDVLLRVVVGQVEAGSAAGGVGVLSAAAVVELGGVGRVAVLELVVAAQP